jgi:hypothetical protein
LLSWLAEGFGMGDVSPMSLAAVKETSGADHPAK